MKLLFAAVALFLPTSALASDADESLKEHFAAIERNVHAAIDGADELIVESFEGAERRPVWHSTTLTEIRALGPAIRIRLPKVEVKVVNGKEVHTFPGYRCMCDQGVLITLKAKGKLLLSLTIKHGQNALSEQVGDFGLEETAFKPFNDQILERVKKASQPPAPKR